MKLALHRSITFWSGILVMGFLAWAWWDSFAANSTLVYRSHGAALNLGGLTISQNTYGAGRDFKVNRLPHSNTFQKFPREQFQRPYVLRGSALEPSDTEEPTHSMEAWHRRWISSKAEDVRMLRLPIWLVLLGFAAVWTALLMWRVRRRRCITTT